MRKKLVLIILFSCSVLTTNVMAGNKPVLKTGWMFIIQPETHYLFDAQLTGRYDFAGPFAFEYGGGFGINLNTFTSDVLLGGVLSFHKHDWEPYFRAAFLTKWIEKFKGPDISDIALAATLSPGFSYKFKNGRSIGFDIAFEIGEIITHTKRFYWGMMPGMIFIF